MIIWKTYENSIDHLINRFYLFTENLPFYGYVLNIVIKKLIKLNIENKNIKKFIKHINRPLLILLARLLCHGYIK